MADEDAGWFDQLIQKLPQGAASVGNALGGGGSFGAADLTPEQRTSAGNHALLNFGLNLLANSGYSAQPRGLGQLIAGGAQAAEQSLYSSEQAVAHRETQALAAQMKSRQIGVMEQDRQIKLMLLRNKLESLKRIGDVDIFGTEPAGAAGGSGGGGAAGAIDPSAVKISDDVPEGARPLLQLIAARESGANPNLYYGGTTFADLTKFPQWPGVKLQDGRMTHAAGKYQFQPGTWERVAPGAGVSDFSEASQDKAAYALAGSEYQRATGRDLLTDLKDPARHDAVLKALSPAWPALRNATAAALPGAGGRAQVAGPGAPTATVPAAAGAVAPAGAPPAPGAPPQPAAAGAPPQPGAAPAAASPPGATAAAAAGRPPELDPMDAEDARAQARIDALRAETDRDFRTQQRIAKASDDPRALAAVAKDYEARKAELNAKQLELERERRTRKDELAKEARARAAALELKEQEHRQALELEQRKADAGRGATFDNTNAIIDADKLKRSDAAAQSARNQLSAIDQIELLLPGLGDRANFTAEARPQLFQIGQSLGLGTASLDAKLENWQALSAVVNRVAAEMRPAGAGSMSDQELDIYRSAFPGMAKDATARRMILALMRTAALRKQQEHEFREEYFQTKKTTAGVNTAMDKALGFMIKRPPALTFDTEKDQANAQEYLASIPPGTAYYTWRTDLPTTAPPTMTWAIQGENHAPIYVSEPPPSVARALKLRPPDAR